MIVTGGEIQDASQNPLEGEALARMEVFIDAEVFMDYLVEAGTLTPAESRVTFIPGD